MGSPSNHQREIETDAIERKTRSFSLSPERVVSLKIGALWTGGVAVVGCVITCTAYIVRMEGKVDRTYSVMEQMKPEHDIMWRWYDRERTASRGYGKQVGP
jgi:hypothetical protein